MMSRFIVPLLAFACLLSTVKSQCDLNGRAKEEKEFPDLMKNVALSYVMGVEFIDSSKKRTDYYVEYYDGLNKRGRLDIHSKGENVKYLYQSETWETWLVTDFDCQFRLINESLIPTNNWDVHYANGSEAPTTLGPSAMLKKGFDAWNERTKGDNKMAYMGEVKELIRGEQAERWRVCTGGKKYVDFFFAVSYEENPSDTEFSSLTPLRVTFKFDDYSQYYDFMSFQRFIPADLDPFQIPKGMNCRRSFLAPEVTQPDFSSKNIFLSSEVLYERFRGDRNIPLASYYSTLTFALNRKISHLAYITAQWNSTKPSINETDRAPKEYPAEHIVYDTKAGFFYNISLETDNCQMGRKPNYYPQYQFPEGRGSIAVTDEFVFLPNNELKFLTTGTIRGLDVDIFELEVTDLLLTDDVVHKAIVTHAYLSPNVMEENIATVKQAPVQMQLRLYRDEETLEVLTFNVFGFTTEIPKEGKWFDIKDCYRNNDDYSMLTLGFEIEDKYLAQVQKKLPQIEQSVVDMLTLNTELNSMRLQDVRTDMKRNYVYVTILVLERPPFQLDFTNVEFNKTVKVTSDDDKEGVSTFKSCAQSCLEQRRDCWGFSKCGDTCYFGYFGKAETKDDVNCIAYSRYDNKSTIASKDKVFSKIFNQVNEGEFSVSLALEEEDVDLVATFVEETDPAEDDNLFNKMGNVLNPRMMLLKVGAKLKQGTQVKNMGKLRYDECQSLCLDFKECETVSYCLSTSECMISTVFDSDLAADGIENNQLCNLLAKRYSDHFDRTPGLTISGDGGTVLDIPDMEDCARACLKENKFNCLSFDHCPNTKNEGCTLYKVHYLNPADRKKQGEKKSRCGHYTRKLSAEFKKKEETRILGSKIASLLNLTLEECAKTCVEFGSGVCYGYDFCQDSTLLSTSCTLFDTDPSRLKSSYSAICTHFSRTAEEYAPRPYANSYAGGIGFLCFLVGVILGGGVILFLYKRRQNRG